MITRSNVSVELHRHHRYYLVAAPKCYRQPVLPSTTQIDHSPTPVLAHYRSLVDRVQPAGVEEAPRHHIPHVTSLFVHSHACQASDDQRTSRSIQ
ncbi:hypothetical protein WG66_000842 [Moniliophthora roreri]|nr:hypothetical protein WG66_000842 [Moniliophthora roreri]